MSHWIISNALISVWIAMRFHVSPSSFLTAAATAAGNVLWYLFVCSFGCLILPFRFLFRLHNEQQIKTFHQQNLFPAHWQWGNLLCVQQQTAISPSFRLVFVLRFRNATKFSSFTWNFNGNPYAWITEVLKSKVPFRTTNGHCTPSKTIWEREKKENILLDSIVLRIFIHAWYTSHEKTLFLRHIDSFICRSNTFCKVTSNLRICIQNKRWLYIHCNMSGCIINVYRFHHISQYIQYETCL